MVSPLLTIIGAFDLVAGILLIFPFPGTTMFAFALLMLTKSIWSILSSVASGFYYDALGLVDFIGAATLLVLNFGLDLGFAWIIGLIIVLKALYSVYSSLSF